MTVKYLSNPWFFLTVSVWILLVTWGEMLAGENGKYFVVIMFIVTKTRLVDANTFIQLTYFQMMLFKKAVWKQIIKTMVTIENLTCGFQTWEIRIWMKFSIVNIDRNFVHPNRLPLIKLPLLTYAIHRHSFRCRTCQLMWNLGSKNLVQIYGHVLGVSQHPEVIAYVTLLLAILFPSKAYR